MDCHNPVFYSQETECTNSQLLVNTSLTPSTAYKWKITDYHGNIYYQDFNTDGLGKGVIDFSQLPGGLANCESPGLKIEVLSESFMPVGLILTTSFTYVDLTFRAGAKNDVGL